jgi:hypothetical protein
VNTFGRAEINGLRQAPLSRLGGGFLIAVFVVLATGALLLVWLLSEARDAAANRHERHNEHQQDADGPGRSSFVEEEHYS